MVMVAAGNNSGRTSAVWRSQRYAAAQRTVGEKLEPNRMRFILIGGANSSLLTPGVKETASAWLSNQKQLQMERKS